MLLREEAFWGKEFYIVKRDFESFASGNCLYHIRTEREYSMTTRTTDKEEEGEEEKRLMEKYDRALTSNGVRKRRGLRRLFALSSPSEEEEEEEIEEEEEFFELDAKALFSSCYRDDRLHLVAFAHDDDDDDASSREVETIGYGDGGNIFDSREKILRERNARLDEDVRRVRDLLERLKTNRMEHRRRGDEREEENGGDVGSSSSARGGKERTRFLLPSVERTTATTRGRETIIERWSIPAEELVARSVGLQPRDDDDDDDDRDKNENESINAQLKAAVAATTTTKASPPLSAESLRLAGVLL